MAASWTVKLNTPSGQVVRQLDEFSQVTAVKRTNGVGSYSVTMPLEITPSLLALNALVEVWREPYGGSNQLIIAGPLRWWRLQGDGTDAITELKGFDANWWLDGRIIAYAAGTAEAAKSGAADDVIVEFVDENLNVAGRRIDVATLTITASTGQGATISKGASRQPLLKTIQDVAAASTADGEPIFFEIEPTVSQTAINYRFYTKHGQLGNDLTGIPSLEFSAQNGNLANPALVYDFSEERNYMYVGGGGEGEERDIVEVYDNERLNAAAGNRLEMFVDARDVAVGSTAILESRGQTALTKNMPRVTFEGDAVESPTSQYGIHWKFGDKVRIAHRGLTFDGHIDRVLYSYGAGETIEAKITADIDLELVT